MRKQSSAQETPDSTSKLKTLALQDDPQVREYRDLHYQLILDQLQATGQIIVTGETVAPLPDTKRKRLMKQHAVLAKKICRKYRISGFYGGSPHSIKRDDWLATLRVSLDERLTIETNWSASSFSPRIQLHLIPKDAVTYSVEGGTVHQLPGLSKYPQGSAALMTIRLDLSRVKPNALDPLAEEFKQAVKGCLAELPKRYRKPSSAWDQNVERDYRRFQLRYYQEVPYRWITVYERLGTMPKRRVTGPVPTESSIRDSVERVHRIVFGKKLTTSRRSHKPVQATFLATTLKQFNCSDHGDDCPNSCQYAREFIRNLQQIR